MPGGVVIRHKDAAIIDQFLASAAAQPSALVVGGEAGIGKTTLWLAAAEQAAARGFRVLTARPTAAESVLAYASLVDLLAGVDPAIWDELPDPQRLAIDRALLRVEGDLVSTDQHAVAAGFVSVLRILAAQTPLVVAIDDVQWLDPSSARVIEFAARRLEGRTGLLATIRNDGSGTSWLPLPQPAETHHIQVDPLSLGALHNVITARLGRSFTRPTMVRIRQISGGNPFYALELARAIGTSNTTGIAGLPDSLAALVRLRIGRLDEAAQSVLLAAACVGAPTVDLVIAATDLDADTVGQLLEDAEDKGIVAFDGQRVRFAHPLLASGVYVDAKPAHRRRMHHRLADIVEQPELRARHLALASFRGDPETLATLDSAADMARLRGAPDASAELLDLAIGLGGDTPARRIRSASDHFSAGELERSRTLVDQAVSQLDAGPERAEALNLSAAVYMYHGSHVDGIAALEQGLREVGDNSALRTQMLTTLALAQLNVGDLDSASANLEQAVADAQRLGSRGLLSQALGIRALAQFSRGDGMDEEGLRRAVELEDDDVVMAVAFRPSMQQALLLACTGRLEVAAEELAKVRRRSIGRGDESELLFGAFYSTQIDIWRGNFAAAEREAEDARQRAAQMGGDLPQFLSLTIQATLAAYAGRVDQVRSATAEAMAAGIRCGSTALMAATVSNLGFLEVSLGDYPAAMNSFAMLLPVLDAMPRSTEILMASFAPDAAEALIQLGRLPEAEVLIDRLESNGARLDRAWMLAVGARCRAMLLAATGDSKGAGLAVARAMTEHERLPMPFEHARTELLLGQLQRRRRQKDAAVATLQRALTTFERLGIPLWAERARAELSRTNVKPGNSDQLTATEWRVAELAASGMTNRDVAAALFISPKTVEVNLSRVYRKLGIRSRAELGRRMADPHRDVRETPDSSPGGDP